MSTTTQVKKVKINKISKAHYAEITPVASEFYLLTDVLDAQYDVLPIAEEKYVNQITQYTGESIVGGYTNGYFYKCTAQGTSPETYAWVQTDVQPETEVINNVTSTSTTSALSANMGKTLQDQITNLKNIGRFLSVWDSATGQPTTNPEVIPYTYKQEIIIE